MSCPNEQTLKNFVAARLESVEEDALSDHLADCAECRRCVEQLEQEDDSHSEKIQAGLLHSPKKSANAELDDLLKMKLPESDPEPESSSRTPETIGPYKIVGFLGRGGMGSVYKGFHPHLKREVAIKVIRESRTDNPNAVTRFRREMEAVGKLHHPNIVSAFDAGPIHPKEIPQREWSSLKSFLAVLPRR